MKFGGVGFGEMKQEDGLPDWRKMVGLDKHKHSKNFRIKNLAGLGLVR